MQPRQIPEAWSCEDDWTGLSDPAERRKRQNRLNQRLYRKRKHLQHFAPVGSDCEPEARRIANEECSNDTRITSCAEIVQNVIRCGDLPNFTLTLNGDRLTIIEFKQILFLNHTIKLRPPSDLGALARLNLLNGLATNAVALSIPFFDLDRDDCISPFNIQGPNPPGAHGPLLSAPVGLRPTVLQRAVIHHPWVDIFPIPGIRDNILRCLYAKRIDEDELCNDLFSVEAGEDTVAPLTVWGDPTNAMSWEFSPEILRKWKCLVEGCPEVFEATNFWRQTRGRSKLVFHN